jgi:glycerophosphoryl diester phosphodiesterase
MFDFPKRPLVIGHRGARGLYPENTVPGFCAAVERGAEAIELDVAVSADGVLIATHDLTLNPDIVRGVDGRWLEPPTPRIRDLTFEQLRSYDVGRLRPGSAYAGCFPAQQPIDGARMPSLQEVLFLEPRLPLLIEMKTSPAEPELTVGPVELAELIWDAVNAAGASERSALLSFDWRGLRHMRQHRPDAATGWLTQRMDKAERRLWWGADLAERCGYSAAASIVDQAGRFWLPELAELSKGAVMEAHRLGLSVVPWNVESPEAMLRAFALGVDGLIPDRPDLAIEARAVRKRSGTPGVA